MTAQHWKKPVLFLLQWGHLGNDPCLEVEKHCVLGHLVIWVG